MRTIPLVRRSPRTSLACIGPSLLSRLQQLTEPTRLLQCALSRKYANCQANGLEILQPHQHLEHKPRRSQGGTSDRTMSRAFVVSSLSRHDRYLTDRRRPEARSHRPPRVDPRRTVSAATASRTGNRDLRRPAREHDHTRSWRSLLEHLDDPATARAVI